MHKSSPCGISEANDTVTRNTTQSVNSMTIATANREHTHELLGSGTKVQMLNKEARAKIYTKHDKLPYHGHADEGDPESIVTDNTMSPLSSCAQTSWNGINLAYRVW